MHVVCALKDTFFHPWYP